MKIVGAIVGGVLLLGAGAYAGANLFPKTIEHTSTVEKIVTVDHNVTVEVPVEKIVYQNVTKEVLVDNGNLFTVEKFIWDNSGDIEFLTHDLKEKEIEKIADRIIFVNDIESMAVQDVKDRAFDKLDGKEVGGKTLIEKKMSGLRVKDDYSDIKMLNTDFEYQDADVLVNARFLYDDTDYYNVTFRVSYLDNHYDNIVIDSINKE